jgi:hypothetical protein
MVAFFWRSVFGNSGSGIYLQPSQNGPGDFALGRNMEIVIDVAGPARAAITVVGKIAVGEDWITIPKGPDCPQSVNRKLAGTPKSITPTKMPIGK